MGSTEAERCLVRTPRKRGFCPLSMILRFMYWEGGLQEGYRRSNKSELTDPTLRSLELGLTWWSIMDVPGISKCAFYPRLWACFFSSLKLIHLITFVRVSTSLSPLLYAKIKNATHEPYSTACYPTHATPTPPTRPYFLRITLTYASKTLVYQTNPSPNFRIHPASRPKAVRPPHLPRSRPTLPRKLHYPHLLHPPRHCSLRSDSAPPRQ